VVGPERAGGPRINVQMRTVFHLARGEEKEKERRKEGFQLGGEKAGPLSSYLAGTVLHHDLFFGANGEKKGKEKEKKRKRPSQWKR